MEKEWRIATRNAYIVSRHTSGDAQHVSPEDVQRMSLRLRTWASIKKEYKSLGILRTTNLSDGARPYMCGIEW